MPPFHATLRQIPPDDPRCLAMRRAVLAEELGWVHADTGTQVALRDGYDCASEAYGVFLAETLIGVGRLVRADAFKQLPSGACFVADLGFSGGLAEISKCMVASNWRGRGVFRSIIHHCLIRSSELHVERVVISIIDSSRGRRFLSDLGFEVDVRRFKFRDDLISPEQDAILLWRRPPDSREEICQLSVARDRLLRRIELPGSGGQGPIPES